MNIVLVGYRCSGKTTVGKILAYKMGREFIDTDQVIEEIMSCPISSIVAQKGWNYFREIEKKVIRESSRLNDRVIATGGGAILDAENVTNLRSNAFLIWLDGNSDVMKERFKSQHGSAHSRPPLTGADPLEEFDGVMESRRTVYEKAAHYAVDTSFLTSLEVADSIMRHLPNGERA